VRSFRFRRLGALAVMAALVIPSVVPAAAQSDDDSAQVILDWNVNALGAAGKAGGSAALTGLYLAMTHGAVYDAVVSIAGGYQPYIGKLDADPTASKVAAAATAAHDVLAALFPDQAADLQTLLDTSLGTVADGPAKDAGVAVGKAAAAAMLAEREGDGRGGERKPIYGDAPGEYRLTPPDMAEFGAAWIADVKPFVAEGRRGLPHRGPGRAGQCGVRGRVQ